MSYNKGETSISNVRLSKNTTEVPILSNYPKIVKFSQIVKMVKNKGFMKFHEVFKKFHDGSMRFYMIS